MLRGEAMCGTGCTIRHKRSCLVRIFLIYFLLVFFFLAIHESPEREGACRLFVESAALVELDLAATMLRLKRELRARFVVRLGARNFLPREGRGVFFLSLSLLYLKSARCVIYATYASMSFIFSEVQFIFIVEIIFWGSEIVCLNDFWY